MSALGRVSRVSPVQTAVRNCTRDEGGPFGFGDQELIPSCRKLLIAVTAFAMKGDEEKILEGGCDAYITKPISISTFLETVERFAKPLVAERAAV
jgi:CheY-like chemotaxis protein